MRSRLPWVVGLGAGVATLLAVLAFWVFARRPPQVVVPELTAPIQIAYGARFTDGGSTAVCLVGANGAKLWLVNPGWFGAEEKGFKVGNPYVGTYEEVESGKGPICPIPSEAATKIARYLELAILNVDPTFDVRLDQRQIGRLAPGPVDLSSAKFILQRIRVLEADSKIQATSIK